MGSIQASLSATRPWERTFRGLKPTAKAAAAIAAKTCFKPHQLISYHASGARKMAKLELSP